MDTWSSLRSATTSLKRVFPAEPLQPKRLQLKTHPANDLDEVHGQRESAGLSSASKGDHPLPVTGRDLHSRLFGILRLTERQRSVYATPRFEGSWFSGSPLHI